MAVTIQQKDGSAVPYSPPKKAQTPPKKAQTPAGGFDFSRLVSPCTREPITRVKPESGSSEFDIPTAIETMLLSVKPYRYTGETKKPYLMKSVPSYYRVVFERVYNPLPRSTSLEMGHCVCACALYGIETLMSSEEVREFIALSAEIETADLGSVEQVKLRRQVKDWKYKPEEHDLGSEQWSIKIDPGIMAYFDKCMAILRFSSRAAFLIPCIGAGLAGQVGCHPDFTDHMLKEQERQLKAISEQSRMVRKVFNAFK